MALINSFKADCLCREVDFQVMVREECGTNQDGVGIDKGGFRFDEVAIKEKLNTESVFFDFHSACQLGNNSSEKQGVDHITAGVR